jgi:hypothetical protein
MSMKKMPWETPAGTIFQFPETGLLLKYEGLNVGSKVAI